MSTKGLFHCSTCLQQGTGVVEPAQPSFIRCVETPLPGAASPTEQLPSHCSAARTPAGGTRAALLQGQVGQGQPGTSLLTLPVKLSGRYWRGCGARSPCPCQELRAERLHFGAETLDPYCLFMGAWWRLGVALVPVHAGAGWSPEHGRPQPFPPPALGGKPLQTCAPASGGQVRPSGPTCSARVLQWAGQEE